MSEPGKQQAPSRGYWRVIVLVAPGVIFWRAVFWRGPRPPVVVPQPVNADARNRQLLVGVWEDHYAGKRTMTLKADGTGAMLVELSGVEAFLSAPRLNFHLKWSLEGGQLKERTTGGEPATQVKMILAMKGDHADQPILELTQDHLTLLDPDGETRYYWKRAASRQ